MGAFQFTLQYDPGKFGFGEVTDWYTGIDAVTVGTPAPGLITFVWAGDVSGISINDGTLCNLHFVSNSTDGSVVSFVGNPTQIEFTEFDGTAFEPVFIDGVVGSPTGIEALDHAAFNIYPNPVSNKATVTYTIQSDCDVTLSVFNAMGQEIKVLASVPGQNAGTYTVKFDGTGLNAGVYYCKLKLNNNTIVKKIVLAR
jgi:hypothetical protein